MKTQILNLRLKYLFFTLWKDAIVLDYSKLLHITYI